VRGQLDPQRLEQRAGDIASVLRDLPPREAEDAVARQRAPDVAREVVVERRR